MSITFEKIRWQNFLSTGNLFTEIELNKSNTTLICGINGSGKSTVMDAICYALFNKPFRKINKPQLLNSITNRGLLVEIFFSVGKNSYVIRRGMKPNIFEIMANGKMIDQSANSRDYQDILEKNILKMNYKTFCQIVVLGSANFVPFMQLPAAARRNIIEDLLDIQIFSVMNNLLRDKITNNKNLITECDHKMKLLQNTIDINKKNSEQNRKQFLLTIKKKQKEIATNEAEIEKLNKKIESIRSKMVNYEDIMKKKSKAASQIVEFSILEKKIESSIASAKKEISFYESSTECHTCKQEIPDRFKESQIEKKRLDIDKKKSKLETVFGTIEKIHDRMEKLQSRIDKYTEMNNMITSYNSQITFILKHIRNIQNEISEIEKMKMDMRDDSAEQEKFQSLKKEYEELLNEREVYNIAVMLLKDSGIKTHIIKQYIPVMNNLINKYLDQMEFFCQFNINENFEEIIKSRYRDEFSYESFSEGEKMRIDLALLFTWREIARMRNSASVNLLILDEIMDSSLDQNGTEEFIKIITQIASKNNIFIISHKHEQIVDKFNNVIRFEKTKNFSKIAA